MKPIHSIIVPIHNGSEFIHLFWASLCQNLLDAAEIIVIDDESREEIARLVPDLSLPFEVRVLRNESPQGYAKAVNRGLKESQGDFVYLLNTDLILGVGALNLIHSYLENDRSLGIVGAKLLYPQTGLIQHFGLAFSETRKFHVFTHMAPTHPIVSRPREFQAVTFALCGFRRNVYLELGGLDSLYTNGCEDIDYCLRARENGYRIIVPPEVTSYHWESLSGESRHSATLENEARFWGRWTQKLIPDVEIYLAESLKESVKRLSIAQSEFTIVNLTPGNDYIHNINIIHELLRNYDRCDMWDYSRATWRKNHILLPMTLPADAIRNLRPFLFIVQEYPQLLQNHFWFKCRNRVDDLIFDLYGNIVQSSDPLFYSLPARQKDPLDAS